MKRVQIRLRKTFDSSATPKRGEKPAQPKRLEEVDLSKLKAKLAESVKQAEQDDPKLLRKKIAELERELARIDIPETSDFLKGVQLEAAHQVKRWGYSHDRSKSAENWFWLVGYLAGKALRAAITGDKTKAQHHTISSAAALLNWHSAIQGDATDSGIGQDDDLRPSNPIDAEAADAGAETIAPNRETKTFVRATWVAGRETNGAKDATIPKGERIVLIALAQHAEGCSREQLSVLTGYKRSSRDTYLQRLRERGYIEVSGDSVLATSTGIGALGSDYEPLPKGAKLLQHWLGKLPTGEAAILDLVVSKYPRAADRDWLTEKSGYLRSSRDTYIQRLRSRKLVDAVGRGEVKASDALF